MPLKEASAHRCFGAAAGGERKITLERASTAAKNAIANNAPLALQWRRSRSADHEKILTPRASTDNRESITPYPGSSDCFVWKMLR